MKTDLRVLLLEDNPNDARLLTFELQKAFNPIIKTVEHEKEFERALIDFDPEIVLSDYNLPSFDGTKALMIRQQIALNKPFILVTGSLNEETAVEIMKAGADDYILKENLSRLIPAIKSALEKKAIFRSKKETETALIESERRFRTMIEMSSDGILLVNKNGIILFLNSQAEILLGSKKENLIGNLFDDRILVGECFEKDIYDRYSNLGTAEVNVQEIEWNNEVVYLVSLHDITERKKAADIIHRERTLLKMVIDNIPFAIYTKDLEGRRTLANQADLNNLGCTFEEEVLNKTDFHFLPKEVAVKLALDDEKVLQEGISIIDREELQIDRYGNRHWLLSSKLPLYNEKGEITGLLGIAKDFTERQQMLDALRESEEKYRILLEHSGFGIGLFDLDGNVLMLNKKAATDLGGKGVDYLGKSVIEIYGQEQGDVYLQRIKLTAKTGKSEEFEDYVKLHSGNRWFISNFTRMHDANGNVTGVQIISHDITDRKLVEEELRQSEERFRQLFISSPDAIMLLEINDNGYGWPIIDCNEAACKMNGYTREELIGQSVDILNTSPGSREERANYLEHIRKSGTLHLESLHKHRDGHVFPIEISTSIVNFKGREHVLGIDRDITERKRLQQELQANEARYMELFDKAPIGYHELDTQGKFVHVNLTELNMLGYSKEEMVGQFVWKFVGDETTSRNRVLDKLKGLISPARGEERTYRKKDGTEIQVLVEEIILHDASKNISGIRTTIQDITQRKLAEKQIKLLAHSVRSVSECVSITDSNDNIVFVNEAFIKTYGYAEEELIGKHISIVRPKDRVQEGVQNILPETLAGGWKGEVINCRKDGTEFPVFLSTSIIKDDQNNPVALVGVATDITEDKKSTEELIKAKEKAEKSDKLKTEFLAQMSHEIRSPMHAILSFTNLAKDDLEENLTPELADYFSGIETAGKRLIRTVDLILNTSEMQLGTYEPIIIKFDLLSRVFNPLADEYSKIAKQKGLQFKIISELEKAEISADLYSISQIFLQLLDNAVKYTEKGKVEIIVKRSKDNAVIVTVHDTGIGMSKEFMQHIFTPFMQEERGYSRKFEGNGLGLLLVKYYCDMNKAPIVVTSEKGKGSKFEVTLILC